MGSITDVVRDLETELKQQQTLLTNYRQNTVNKSRVEQMIASEQYNFTCAPAHSGNAWEIAENLRQNIEKVSNEIHLYECVEKGETPTRRLKFR